MPHHGKIGPSAHATNPAPLPGNSLSWHSLSPLIPRKGQQIFGIIISCPIMETLSFPFMPLTLQPSRKFPQLALTLFHVISKKCEKLFWRKTISRGLARQARRLQGLEAWELAGAFQAGQGLEAWGLAGGAGRPGNQFEIEFLGLEISSWFFQKLFQFCAFFCATLCSELCYFSEIIVLFFLVFSFVLFFVLLCVRNCATFRKFLCFLLVFSFVFFLCYFVLGIVLLFGNSCAFF